MLLSTRKWSPEYLEGKASMAAEVELARNAAAAAKMEEAKWRKRHRSVSKALFCAVAFQFLLMAVSVILWLLRRGA